MSRRLPPPGEQLVTFLYRYAAMHGVDTAAGGSLSNFPDASSVSEYAQQPMLWAVQTGLLQGMDGRLAPQSLRNPRTDRCVPDPLFARTF